MFAPAIEGAGVSVSPMARFSHPYCSRCPRLPSPVSSTPACLLRVRCSVKQGFTGHATANEQPAVAGPIAVEVPQQQQEEVWDYVAPDHVLQRNQQFAEQIRGKVLLAPLTKGGNLPFRRLCCDYDPELATVSEMAFARQLLKGDRIEKARLYKAHNEQHFAVQIATNNIAEGVKAAAVAQEAGAAWLDINCGCPIHEATKRGLGAALLRRPTKLAKMVAGIVAKVDLPVTVKIRTGESEKKINAARVVGLLQQAGAAAVIIHGRTMEQRYKKAADWQLMADIVQQHSSLPVIGNGDILTHYEAAARWQSTGVAGVMVGRGALIKPWLFQEIQEGRELQLTAADRVGTYRKLASYMKEHFRDDSWGKRKAFYFLPWHFSFFCRYRPLPADVYEQQSHQHPLIATRADLVDHKLGEELGSLPLLERLLRCENEAAHGPIADIIWDSSNDAEAVQQLEALGGQQLAEWEQQLKASSRAEGPADMAVEG